MKLKIISNILQADSLIVSFFEELDQDFFPYISKRTTIKNYIKSIFENNGRLILYVNEQEIYGILGLTFNHPTYKNYIQYIGVSKPHRNKGISEILFSKAEELFLIEGVTLIAIRTWSSNLASNNLFSKLGFLHVFSVLDDREEGIHSNIYMKSIVDLKIDKPIKNIGIIGGMGTYSTATFIETISKIPCSINSEQKLTNYSLINDATIPDRTAHILNKTEYEVTNHIQDNIEKLKLLDISHLIVLCFTIHPYLKHKNDDKTEFINLLTITSEILIRKKGKYLLAATNGTYLTMPFKDKNIIYPNKFIQSEIHSIIYNIKKGIDVDYYKNKLIEITKQLKCDGVLLGCTDLHKMFGYNFNYSGVEIIDPLTELVINMSSKTIRKINITNCSLI